MKRLHSVWLMAVGGCLAPSGALRAGQAIQDKAVAAVTADYQGAVNHLVDELRSLRLRGAKREFAGQVTGVLAALPPEADNATTVAAVLEAFDQYDQICQGILKDTEELRAQYLDAPNFALLDQMVKGMGAYIREYADRDEAIDAFLTSILPDSVSGKFNSIKSKFGG